MAPPPALRRMRPHRFLRRLAQPACERPRPILRASDHPQLRAGRRLVLGYRTNEYANGPALAPAQHHPVSPTIARSSRKGSCDWRNPPSTEYRASRGGQAGSAVGWTVTATPTSVGMPVSGSTSTSTAVRCPTLGSKRSRAEQPRFPAPDCDRCGPRPPQPRAQCGPRRPGHRPGPETWRRRRSSRRRGRGVCTPVTPQARVEWVLRHLPAIAKHPRIHAPGASWRDQTDRPGGRERGPNAHQEVRLPSTQRS